VVNHAGLWIHVVVVHWPLIEESPRLRFESARDYAPFEAVLRVAKQLWSQLMDDRIRLHRDDRRTRGR
jgi:hypothetical protein